jgi:predicted methyltransferase
MFVNYSILNKVRILAFAVLLFALGGCSAAIMQQTRRTSPQSSPAAAAQSSPLPTQEPPSQDDAINRVVSDPYTGDLSIFEDSNRERNLQINRVMDILGIREGTSVADIGAGSGWFTVRAARRAGANGTVYAVEINREYLNHIERRAERENLPNIRTVLGREDDPSLPPASVDAVLILKTYHEIAEPVRVMRRLRPALREGARVGIIDRNGTGDDHGIDRDVVVREMARAGYTLVEEHDFVRPDNMDYFLVFQARR